MATYRIKGIRFLRKYSAERTSPVYASSVDVQKIVNSLCNVPWEMVYAKDATMTYHTEENVGTEEEPVSGLDMNVRIRDQFDAALFCAGHSGGQHRAYANAAVYRYELPDDAVGTTMESIKVNVTSDPYNSNGARIHVMTNSTGDIPTGCHICRGEDQTGTVIDDGTTASRVAVRTTVTSGGESYWYPTSETCTLSPQGGLVLRKYLFVFVLMESYATVRGNWIEGCSHIENLADLTTSTAVNGWTDGETYDLSIQTNTYPAFNPVRTYRKGDIVAMLQNTLPMGRLSKSACYYSPILKKFLSVVAGRRFPGNGGRPPTVCAAVSGSGFTSEAGIYYSLDAGLTFNKASGTGTINETYGDTTYTIPVNINQIIFSKIYHCGGDILGVEDGLFVALPKQPEDSAYKGSIPWYSEDGITWHPGTVNVNSVAHGGNMKIQASSVGKVRRNGNLFVRLVASCSSGNFYSADGKTWNEANSPIRSQSTQNGNQVIYYYAFDSIANDMNGVWLAVCRTTPSASDNPTTGIFKSTDGGETWTSVAGVDGGKPRHIHCANRMFVLTLEDGSCYYVYEWDGSGNPEWSLASNEITSGIRGDVRDIGYNNATMLVATDTGIWKSTNAILWRNGEGSPKDAERIVYRSQSAMYNGAWFAASKSGGIFMSMDNGDTWTNVLSGNYVDVCPFDYGAEPPRYIAVCGTSSMAISENGTEWDYSSLPDPGNPDRAVTDIKHIGDLWLSTTMTTGLNSQTGTYRSKDGITWTLDNSRTDGIFFATENMIVSGARSNSSGMFYSSDKGRTWNLCASDGISNTSFNALDIRHAESGLWICLGRLNIFFSKDGKTWSTALGGSSSTTRANGFVRHGNGMWVAVSRSTDGGELLWSDNGILWTRARSEVVSCSEPVYDGHRWVVVINGSVITSENGKQWTDVREPSGDIVLDSEIVTNGKTWIRRLADGSGIAYSTDLSEWTPALENLVDDDADETIEKIFFCGGIFIAVTTDFGHYALSQDGIHWSAHSTDALNQGTGLKTPTCCSFDFKSRIVFGCAGSDALFMHMEIPVTGSTLSMMCEADKTEPLLFLPEQWNPVQYN